MRNRAGGDEAAAGELFERVWPDAYRIACSALHDRSLAEEAAQGASARAWASLSQLRKPERFAVWFYRIVLNECRRLNRDRARTVPLNEALYHRGEPPSDERIDVRNAVSVLPAKLRTIVVLRYYYRLDNAEIAEIIGTSSITVRWHLMNAHRRLRELLGDRVASNQSLTRRESYVE
ncbi:MAG TPA: sigma-70 family RNA polymerase sigma factor [Candidatus Baltobacteraceae bacterium]|nr:sigma-70 family RNA polymerase sigma factor [Candidatus Baltobacteraceae bacterium]